MLLLKNIMARWQHHQQTRAPNALELTFFLRQFATLLTAGIAVMQACQLLEMSQSRQAMRLFIFSIRQALMSGKTLCQSVRLQAPHFNEFMISLVQIGEQTGTLATQLERLATYQENRLRFSKRIKQLLFYPSVIFMTAIIVTSGLFLFVIPRFADLFQQSQTHLPWLTECLFCISRFLQQQGGLGVALLLCILSIMLYHQPLTKWRTTLLHRAATLPLLKTYLRQLALARFARQLAVTYAAGLPITEGLTLAANATHPHELCISLLRLSHDLRAGLRLHHAMARLPAFPTLLIQLVKTGEETGQLDHMLNKAADFIEADLDAALLTASELLEPLIMLILGVVIGGLVIGLYLPIFKLGSTL